jgi:hypothetical protein
MPWTEITRAQYRRNGLRYARDTTDVVRVEIGGIGALENRITDRARKAQAAD